MPKPKSMFIVEQWDDEKGAWTPTDTPISERGTDACLKAIRDAAVSGRYRVVQVTKVVQVKVEDKPKVTMTVVAKATAEEQVDG